MNKYLQKLFIIATTAFLLTACNGIDNTRNNDNDVTNTRYPENVNENPYKYVTNKNRMYCVWQNKSAELCKGKMQSPALNFCA